MRYRMKLINTRTGEKQLSTISFNSKKKAIEWATQWRNASPVTDCEILDTKNEFRKIEF